MNLGHNDGPRGPQSSFDVVHVPPSPPEQEVFCTQDNGYRGIWYANTPLDDEYRYKYSGGLGTYCAKHRPLAIYSPEADRTFFCYGGTSSESWKWSGERIGSGQLLHMVSFYDHENHRVPRPTVLLDKWCSDAHDNPVITLDREGYIWIFSSSHGSSTTPSYIHRSCAPYEIESFEMLATTLFAYPQPWYVEGEGFFLFHTIYNEYGRTACWSASVGGTEWSPSETLARIGEGHYQVSAAGRERLGTAFNFHPKDGELKGLEYRTNLYYVETRDFGRSWVNVKGDPLHLPLTEPENPALIKDYRTRGRRVYMKDLIYDQNDRPVILYLTAAAHRPGPEGEPRRLRVAHWTGKTWTDALVTGTDSNYDTGSLYIEDDKWRIIAPTGVGPQPGNPGGEIEVWESRDQGETWEKVRRLTRGSPLNHTYVRRPLDAGPEFYAFWADGHGRRPSPSHLYFTDHSAEQVWRLPEAIPGKWAEPVPVE